MSKKKRWSKIWKMPKDEFQQLVTDSTALIQILRHFGMVGSHGNYFTLRRRLEEDQIDYSHINLESSWNKGRKFPDRAKPLEEVMVENSTYARKDLKRRLLKNGMLENKCLLCGLEGEWQGKKLVMILDHINGVNDDHRYENLRMLCPNCNSQQETFSGRQNKKKYNCVECGGSITKHSDSKLCKSCSSKKNQPRKVEDRPSVETLLQEVADTSYCAVGRKHGVSDNCIRKWIKGGIV